MKKIKLDTSMTTVSGKPITVIDERTKSEKKVTVGEYFLLLLSTKFEKEELRESFWANDLGIEIASNKEIEISDDKHKFLLRLVTKNQTTNSMDQKSDVFTPVEQGQLLKALGETGE